MQFQPIENYGIIGDLRTIALAGMDGSIDFLCLPRIDSPSVFARLLDYEQGGYFRISPIVNDAKQKQMYVSDTNVLLTRFLSESGDIGFHADSRSCTTQHDSAQGEDGARGS